MPSLRGYHEFIYAGRYGRSDKSRPQRVGAVLPRIESDQSDGRLHNHADAAGMHSKPSSVAANNLGEEGPRIGTASTEPVHQVLEGARHRRRSVWNTDYPPFALLILFFTAYRDYHAAICPTQVGEIEADNVAATERRRKSEAHHGTVTGLDNTSSLGQLLTSLAEMLNRQRALSLGLLTAEPLSASNQGCDRFANRVREASTAVYVPDRGSVALYRRRPPAAAQQVRHIESYRFAQSRQSTPAGAFAPRGKDAPVAGVPGARTLRAGPVNEPGALSRKPLYIGASEVGRKHWFHAYFNRKISPNCLGVGWPEVKCPLHVDRRCQTSIVTQPDSRRVTPVTA